MISQTCVAESPLSIFSQYILQQNLCWDFFFSKINNSDNGVNSRNFCFFKKNLFSRKIFFAHFHQNTNDWAASEIEWVCTWPYFDKIKLQQEQMRPNCPAAKSHLGSRFVFQPSKNFIYLNIFEIRKNLVW